MQLPCPPGSPQVGCIASLAQLHELCGDEEKGLVCLQCTGRILQDLYETGLHHMGMPLLSASCKCLPQTARGVNSFRALATAVDASMAMST